MTGGYNALSSAPRSDPRAPKASAPRALRQRACVQRSGFLISRAACLQVRQITIPSWSIVDTWNLEDLATSAHRRVECQSKRDDEASSATRLNRGWSEQDTGADEREAVRSMTLGQLARHPRFDSRSPLQISQLKLLTQCRRVSAGNETGKSAPPWGPGEWDGAAERGDRSRGVRPICLPRGLQLA